MYVCIPRPVVRASQCPPLSPSAHPGHRSNCLCLDFHPFGDYCVTGSLDTNVKIWDSRRKGCVQTFKVGGIRSFARSFARSLAHSCVSVIAAFAGPQLPSLRSQLHPRWQMGCLRRQGRQSQGLGFAGGPTATHHVSAHVRSVLDRVPPQRAADGDWVER